MKLFAPPLFAFFAVFTGVSFMGACTDDAGNPSDPHDGGSDVTALQDVTPASDVAPQETSVPDVAHDGGGEADANDGSVVHADGSIDAADAADASPAPDA